MRTTKTVALAATVAALMFAAGMFWCQPNPKTLTAELQNVRHSNVQFDADQPKQKSTGALKLALFTEHNDKPELDTFSVSPGACRLVHDAEGNTEGHCDLNRVSTPVSDAGQSPFGTLQWAPLKVLPQR